MNEIEVRMDSPEIVTVKAFIAAINNQDFAALAALMPENHTLVDSGGTTVTGRETMLAGWPQYFAMFPDFKIRAELFLQDGAIVAVFGSWSATYSGKRGPVPENAVSGPAAWRALVEGGQIKMWQVYADHTKTVEVMKRNEACRSHESKVKIRGTDFVVYQVSDLAAAARFYRETLGLSQEVYSEEGQWAEFNCGNVTLSLHGGMKLPEKIAGGRIALAVDDVFAACAELKSKGVRVVGEPVDYGVCCAVEILDPDGNTVILHRRADGTSGQDSRSA
jgi:predicted enzyme related to lactoylglutathione lyase/ketosteroid isomerase-like protein